MAATNYAIEGATGEWTARVCAGPYESGFPPDRRKKGTKWLRVHADYDDTHPWEALEIIATLLGTEPAMRDVESVRIAILKSYAYMQMVFDDAVGAGAAIEPLGRPAVRIHREAALSVAH